MWFTEPVTVRKPELKLEALRLRKEERLSLREIEEITGASKGSLSKWLKPYPLTKQEKKERQKNRDRAHLRKDRGQKSGLHQMAKGRSYTRTDKAKISEAAVLLRLVLHQIAVFGSPFDGDRADWVALTPHDRLLKIQVKWAKTTGLHGLPYITLTHTAGGRKSVRYTKEDFDFIVGYDLFTDTAYVFSYEETATLKRTVSVRKSAAEAWHKLLK